MSETIKIAIPMAGLGTRLRPHTWSKPKPLIRIAGRTVLEYIMDLFQTLPDPGNVEFVFIIGRLGDQVKEFMAEHYPQVRAHYVVQEEMRGQSDALWLAREYLHGPVIVAYADTIIETDFSFLAGERWEGIAWVKPVPDPRRFGVAVVEANGRVTRLIEKPTEMDNNLAVVGFYYLREGKELISAIEEQMRRGITLKGEYFLADAVNILLERGLRMRTQNVDVWLDAGTPEALLETNRYLLEHGRDNSAEAARRPGVVVVPPVFIHPEAEISQSVIGPYVSISAESNIRGSIVRDSIIEEGVQLEDVILEGSILGRDVQVKGQVTRMNLGDQSWAMR
jgi:glucose-1-phosphate thymidylyltransferase